MAEKIKLTIDEKWEVVKRYYESLYQHPITKAYIRFKIRPPDQTIQFLFSEMKKLVDAEILHQEQIRKKLEI